MFLDAITIKLSVLILFVFPTPPSDSVYCHAPHFQRLLGLVANQVTLKARDIVGGDILDPRKQ